jgi:hypothetical protein
VGLRHQFFTGRVGSAAFPDPHSVVTRFRTAACLRDFPAMCSDAVIGPGKFGINQKTLTNQVVSWNAYSTVHCLLLVLFETREHIIVNGSQTPNFGARFHGGKAMKNGSFVSENPSASDKLQSVAATLMHVSNSSMSSGQEGALVGRHNGNGSGELRSTVARQFMHMLRGHDRARMKVLATHPTQAR